MRSRYELLAVENRGYRLARVYDRKHRQELFLYIKGGAVLHWDKQDAPVGDRNLRRVVRGALEGELVPSGGGRRR